MAQNGCLVDVCSALSFNGISLSDNDFLLAWAKPACELIDQMIADNKELSFVECEASNGNIVITLECQFYLAMSDGASHPFFDVIRKFDKFIFATHDPDHLQIKLVKSFMWSK